jgi:hypothetical protein
MGAAIGIETSATGATPWTLRRVVTAGVIGNVLEWYDFAIYGFLAPILAAMFFPATDPRVSAAAFGRPFRFGSSLLCPRPCSGTIPAIHPKPAVTQVRFVTPRTSRTSAT